MTNNEKTQDAAAKTADIDPMPLMASAKPRDIVSLLRIVASIAVVVAAKTAASLVAKYSTTTDASLGIFFAFGAVSGWAYAKINRGD